MISLKKYLKITLLLTVFLIFIYSISSFAVSSKVSSKLKDFDVNDINLNSVDKSKIDDLKEVLEDIDINSLNSTAIVNNIDKSEIASGNFNSINTDEIDIDEVIDIYDKLSEVISNEEIADLIKDNSKLLTEAGISKEALSASETVLRTFDSDAVIDIVQNDLDLDKIIDMYKNGASLSEIISSVLSETSLETKLSIVSKLLFSNLYIRIAIVILIFVAIYSIFITSILFIKAGMSRFGAIIPIYRDVLHLKLCGLSPWLLLLIFIPVLGWLMLIAVAIIGRFELSKRFGHGFLFGLGLLFLPIIFRTVIAFSNDEYIEELYEDDEE